MRAFAAVLLLSTLTSAAAELNPRVANLAGPDARLITGLHVERSNGSALNGAFPFVSRVDALPGVRQIIMIEDVAPPGEQPQPLTILLGALAASVEGDAPVRLDASTSITGDPMVTQAAIRRWSGAEAPGPASERILALAAAYDNWFLIRRPIAVAGREGLPRRARELSEAVEEISGGIRFGAFTEVHVEIRVKSATDAAAIATLGAWLPGFVQLQQPNGPMSRLVDLIDDFTVTSAGSTASLSFLISEAKVRAAMASRD